ncbi:Phagocyte signaling-impaired protein [Seminavis robusta]|uniref:Phagocyte signaling-impaired protein n=1 Tax=Seminavis robusta TaxID=568900 RepID=A0A9N8EFH5_9STRA|nr:Phagocyte signaling-impaired protein [Seminavis robusta]|eukprot:Sro1048_g235240.1 Phagocyte signaling-impaired protein (1066) ;mRNA; f:18580-22046
MSTSNKIHPIYVALDANQYNRAIKLCLALPKENVLAQALLAHAYNKSMQRYKALVVLQSILGKDGFQELQLECQYSKEAWDQQQAAASAPPAPTPAAASKKGKKGKKKPAPAAAKPAPDTASELQKWSLADHLESPPAIEQTWEKIPPVDQAITDETTLGTLVITLQNLRLFLTSYQLYCWAAARVPADMFLRKAYLHGLGVVVSPQYVAISKDILANMQVLALQLGRINQQTTGSARLATSWVAQTALWQLKLIESDANSTSLVSDEDQKKEQQRLALLPRLAENLASKCVGDPMEGELASARREVYFLYLRTLEYQSKWQEMLDLLLSDIFKASDETAVLLAPKQQVLEKQAECMQKLNKFGDARLVFEELLTDYPDNFNYWRGHLECTMAEHGDDESGETAFKITQQFANSVIEKSQGDKYPKRGPHLVNVEIAIGRIKLMAEKQGEVSASFVEGATKAIMEYGGLFEPSVSCAFTDLESYLVTVLRHATDDQMVPILKWLQELRAIPESEDAAEIRRQQRSYIFSVKMTHKIVAERPALADEWLPDWKDLVRTWKKTHSMEAPIQKESLPGDDLILLAIQQVLRGNPDVSAFFIAAVLVEAGVKNSPSNATLKIAALDIYSRLNSASRAWAIYQELQIKHIQLDTCTFLILPILLSGGFYQEILKVSKGLLMLHTSVVREACEFMGRAMDNGILSKADEFMFFQRDKMTNSLSAMEATGYILDSAPFFAHDVKDASLGIAHGIVGGESDFERACDMVIEVRNPFGALSLLGRALVATAFDSISDNRDQSILDYETLYHRQLSSREDIISDSIRRGHSHSLLIRASLCVHYTKGPKKGKIVKPGEELSRCSRVLMAGIEAAKVFCDELTNPIHAHLMNAQLELCRTLLIANSGFGLAEGVDDSLEEREKQSLLHLGNAVQFVKRATDSTQFLEGKVDVAGVCRLLPGSIVPVFATFRMCSEILELFGWGRRKLKTKQVSAEFAKVAIELSVLVKAMLAAFSSDKVPDGMSLFEDLTGIIEEIVIKQTSARVAFGRQETQTRVRPHLENMSAFLDSFETAADN